MISSDSMSLPFVSIIIPAYQSSGTLSHTLESVILQEYSNFEVIVINDGSTDTTLDIIDHYSKLDHRVRCINLKSNSGPAIARNIGVENSHGTLIAFLDADDQWHSCKLKHQVEFMQQSPSTDLVFTDCLNINIDPVTSVREEVRLFSINNNFFKDINLMPVLKSDKFFALNGPIRRSLYSKCFILPSTVILRRSSFDRSGGFNPNRFGTEDIDLWIRLASFGEFVCWNKPTVYRSVTGLGISAMSEKWLL
jgi:glycosyltransferase involved in cell wall biosynthesis